MDGMNDESDINDNTSDDSDENNYELLAQDLNETNEHVTYYEHNVVVNWIDADEYERNNEAFNHSNQTISTNVDVTETNDSVRVTNSQSNDASISQNNDLVQRRLSLNDGKCLYFLCVIIYR
jgi:hypothetical protein